MGRIVNNPISPIHYSFENIELKKKKLEGKYWLIRFRFFILFNTFIYYYVGKFGLSKYSLFFNI